jgi:hypothetical protein
VDVRPRPASLHDDIEIAELRDFREKAWEVSEVLVIGLGIEWDYVTH